MDIKPNIRSNFGPLSPRGFNKMAAKVNERTTRDATRDLLPGTKVFIAGITGNVIIHSNRRFKYTWETANFEPSTGYYVSNPSSINYTTTNIYAYNTCEALQQSSGTNYGPGIVAANIPSGFVLKAIATGTYVQMLQHRDREGNVVFSFSMPNAIDGTCA